MRFQHKSTPPKDSVRLVIRILRRNRARHGHYRSLSLPNVQRDISRPWPGIGAAGFVPVWVQSNGSSPGGSNAQTGSAVLTTSGAIGGFAIFRYNPNGQEAVVPLESRNANAYLLAFDNSSGTATGVAISNSSGQPISVPVTVREGNGSILTTGAIPLPGHGHKSFVLSNQFPQSAGAIGTAEFDTPVGATINVLGIRSPPSLTFTTLPALER